MINVCIIGFGVVGEGVFDILMENELNIKVKYVMELNKEKTEGVTCVTDDLNMVLNDPDLHCVIELIGGTTTAYNLVKKALKAKKSVVTANKALISKYFRELNELAIENNVSLRYEASVGGAINILDPLMTITQVDRIKGISGIINGSTNFILDKIFLQNQTLNKALKEATKLGYIETGTSDDMDGFDLLRKINILSMIAYGQYIKEDEINRYPLSKVSEDFYKYVKATGLRMKYIATSIKTDNGIEIRLEPTIITNDGLYSEINYEDNIITIVAKYHKKQSFVGQGAGRYPTASAVVYDLMKLQTKSKDKLVFDGNVPVNEECEKNYYLIEKDYKFIKTEKVTLNELMEDKKIKSLARIEEDAYEKI